MNFKIGVVTSRFNENITSLLERGAFDYLDSISENGAVIEILAVKVPGAIEIPLACKALFAQGCDGVIALGAVIRGETSHFDYVCNSVERGITALMLEYGRPIGFGVLTTESEEQAFERSGGKHGNKGAEAAQVTIEMVGLLEEIENSASLPILTSDNSTKNVKSAKNSKTIKQNSAQSKKKVHAKSKAKSKRRS